MTHTEVEPTPEKDKYYGDKIVLTYKKSEQEVTGRGLDKKRDEVHETVREVDSETIRVDCPLVSLTNKSTGDQLSEKEVSELVQKGFSDISRTDQDEVEYTVDGEIYVGVYDLSDVPDLDI